MATPYPKRYLGILRDASVQYHIPARVLAAQEFVESGYSPDVISGRRKSSAGAYGISQFIASTGRQYGVRAGTSRAAVRTQVFAHAKYLRDLGYARDARRAIASYAGGPGNPQYGYAAKVLGLAPSYRGVVRGVRGGGGSSVVGGSPATSSRSVQQAGGTALAELTAKGLQRQQGPPSFTVPPAPVHTAHVVLPEGQAALSPQSGLVGPQAASQPTLQELLAAAASDARVQDAKSTVVPGTPGTRVSGGGASGGGMPGGVRHYPAAKRGAIIGTPYVGTHAPGQNWESSNAIDISLKHGTPIVAVVDGVISPGGLGFGPGGSGRFAGDRLHLRGQGNTYFYTHLSRYANGIKPGARVRRGQVIGYSGEANGVPHLHFAQLHGDPRKTIRR